MAETLYFVHNDVGIAQECAAPFAAKGWNVHASDGTDPGFIDQMVADLPVATVFCLDGDSSTGVLHAAIAVLNEVRIPRPLMVFTGGSPAEVEMAKESVPFAVFVKEEELDWVLKRMIFKS